MKNNNYCFLFENNNKKLFEKIKIFFNIFNFIFISYKIKIYYFNK